MIDEMISKADSGQIVEFLRKALKKNSGLANDFRTFVTGEIDSRYLEDKIFEFIFSAIKKDYCIQLSHF